MGLIQSTKAPPKHRKEAGPFYRTSSGVRLCWELEEPKGPKGPKGALNDGIPWAFSPMVLHKVWALVPMILYVVYTPVGVSLSIIHKTHAFISVSLILIGVFFLMAGVCGLGRVVSGVFLTLFIWLCFGVHVDNPDRGHMVALVIIPGLKIVYVCITGVISVLSVPGCGADHNCIDFGVFK